MKIVNIPTAQIGTPTADASPQFRLEDMQNVGILARAAIGNVARDTFPLPGGQDIVFGGNIALTTGLSLQLFPQLTIYRATDGVGFQLVSDQPIPITLAAAEPTLTRIDLIVASEPESQAEVSELRHYRVSPPVP